MASKGLIVAALLAACSGGDGGDDGADSAVTDGTVTDASVADGARSDAATARTILFQCHPFDGGLCTIDADGTDRRTLHAAGFVPHAATDGAILFHTSAYRVNRRHSSSTIDDLGDGAFARPHPDGRILFQCSRVPDIDDQNRILFHTDAYRITRRDPGGTQTDLGAGAFATWTTDGRIIFQCSGLDGGLCRMDADGTNRSALSPSGRVPDAESDASSRLVFHSDAYQLTAGTTPLGAGANAEWW